MADNPDLSIVILAAGQGTRMCNAIPKVMHPLAGRTLIAHVLGFAGRMRAGRTAVVLAPGMDTVQAEVTNVAPDAAIVIQNLPLGTGHAVEAAVDELPEAGSVLVLFGDTPLLTVETIAGLVDRRREKDAAVAVLGMHPEDPSGYGRLEIDGSGELVGIVEHRYASELLRQTAICNSGVMAIDAARLRPLVRRIEADPVNGEFYLTEIVALARAEGWRCVAIEAPAEEGLGVNSQQQLAQAADVLQQRLRHELMTAGVIMLAPQTVFMCDDTEIAPGAVIEPNVVFGPGVRVEAGAIIRAFSYLEHARVGAGAQVGPFARLRPGADIGESARIGNFVEAKNARLGNGAKANHLTYLGDCDVGAGSNIGAGTIICNYDGFSKHRTLIGEDVFVGSNTALVAPLEIGAGSIVGAGSVITRNVPDDTVAVARGEQRHARGRASVLRARFRNKSQPDG